MPETPEILPKCLESHRSLIHFTNDNYTPNYRLFINVTRTFCLASSFVKKMNEKDHKPENDSILDFDERKTTDFTFRNVLYYRKDDVVYVKKEDSDATVATIEDFHPIFEACSPDYFFEQFVYDFPTEELTKVDSSACCVKIKFPKVEIMVTLSKLLEHSELFVELYDDCLRRITGDQICIDVNIDCSKEMANGIKKLINQGHSSELDQEKFIKNVEQATQFLQILDFLGIKIGS